jgi:hypothetical protein
VVDFLRSPKIVATVFLCSGVWLVPSIRRAFPIHGNVSDIVSLVASIAFTLSGASLVISSFIWCFHVAKDKKHLQKWALKRAVKQATPVEKKVLEMAIQKGLWKVALDVGSPIAMHLQEIGLIEQATGLPYTTYQMARGLKDLCIKKPMLLRLSKETEATAQSEIKQWQKEKVHQIFFIDLAGPTSTSWMY